ncbi:MAG: hypothetical protein FWF36_02540, partial [Propionibacteriaceae bacterium]|nr:hypothetical protein [Propionibacteriaceae bacterium]
ERLAAAQAAVSAPATPPPELPEFLRTPRESSKAAPTPAPAAPAPAPVPSWRERLEAASTATASPVPAPEMPEFLRPRGKAGAAAPAAGQMSATDRLAKLLEDTKGFEEPKPEPVVEPEPEPEPEPVAEPEPEPESEPVVQAVIPEFARKPRKTTRPSRVTPFVAPVPEELPAELPVAAELTVPEPAVEPVAESVAIVEPEVPAPRPASGRRPAKTPVIKLPDVAGVVLPTVEPEVELTPVGADLAEPVKAEPEVAEEAEAPAEETLAEPVVKPAPKPRGRRKGAAAPVVAEEPVVEPEAEEQVAPAVAVTAVTLDERPDDYDVTAPEDGSWWDEEPAEEEEEKKPKRKWSLASILLLVLALLLIAGAATTGGIYWYKQAHTPVYLDLNGNKVIPDDNSIFDPSYVQAADAQPDLGIRFKVPSVGLDVPLGSVNQVDNVINPPGYTSVYWVKNMGVSLANADQGTVYVVTHSVRAPGEAPGDYLIDQTTTTVTVQNGAEIDVGDRVYKVVASLTVSKDDLGNQTALWAGSPGMLVLITCMQGGDYLSNGHSATNVVIIGQLVS